MTQEEKDKINNDNFQALERISKDMNVPLQVVLQAFTNARAGIVWKNPPEIVKIGPDMESFVRMSVREIINHPDYLQG